MQRMFLLACLVCLVHASYTQTKSIQSALEAANELKNPNESLNLLRPYLKDLHNIHDSIQAQYFYQLGVAFGMLYQSDSALLFLKKSLSKSKLVSDDLTQIGALNGMGNVVRISSDNEQAREYFEEGLVLAQRGNTDKHRSWESKLLGAIAGIFYEFENYQSALEYAQRALNISRMIGDSVELGTNLIRMGYAYNSLNQPEKALEVNKEAVNLLELTGDSLGLIYQYYNMAEIYAVLEENANAKDQYQRAIDLSNEFGEMEVLTASLNALAEIAIEEQNYRQAQDLIFRSIDLAEKNGILNSKRNSYQLAYKLDRLRGFYRAAIENLEKYHAVKDSIQRSETLKSIENFRVKYETAEKESEILAARQEIESKERFEKFLIVVIAIIIVFGSIAIILLIQRFRLRRALLSQEIDMLRVQINSIFQGGIKDLNITLNDINRSLYKPLSDREFEVLQEAISEKTNREIAETLFLSVNTVKYHLKNVYEKLGVTNRKEALEKILSNS